EGQTHAGEGNGRADLRNQRKIVPRKAELPQQPGQWPLLGTLGREIRDGVEAHVVVATAEAIKRVQPANRGVPLEDADSLLVVCQSNPGGQTRHASADDDRVVAQAWHPPLNNSPLNTYFFTRSFIRGSRYSTVVCMLARCL